MAKLNDDSVQKQALDWLEAKKTERVSYEKSWLINVNVEQGNHYLLWNSKKGSIEVSKTKSVYDVPVNLVKVKHKAMKSSLISSEPVPRAEADAGDPEALTNIDGVNKWLTWFWDETEMQKHTASAVHNALLTSYATLWFDPTETERGDFALDVSLKDSFDVYVDSIPVQAGEYVIIAGMAKKAELENAKTLDEDGKTVKRYKNLDTLKESEVAYESEYKTRMVSIMQGSANVNLKDKIKILECYYKTWEGGQKVINVITLAGEGNTVIRHTRTPYKRFPCALLPLGIAPGQTAGYGWAKDVWELNRALNMLFKSALEYQDFAAKFRLLVQRGSGVKLFTNQNGQIIEYKPGMRPEQLQTNSQNESVFQTMDMIVRRIEDVSGVSDASQGKVPKNVSSGRALQMLQDADAGANTDYRDAYKEFIQDCFEVILEMGAIYINTSQIINVQDEQLAVVGENAVVDLPQAIKLKRDMRVKATVGSALGYSKEARQDMIMQLWDRKLIANPEFVLKQFEIENVEEALAQPMQPGMPGQPQGQEFGTADIEAQLNALESDPNATPEQLAQLETQMNQLAQQAQG